MEFGMLNKLLEIKMIKILIELNNYICQMQIQEINKDILGKCNQNPFGKIIIHSLQLTIAYINRIIAVSDLVVVL